MSKGSYVLFIHMPRSKGIDVGRLGSFRFEAGTYLYVGSALNTLQKRLARHASQTKKLHWHIDYLLQYGTIQKVMTVETEKRIECLLNKAVTEIFPVEAPVKGFGSTDCRCNTHLWRLTSDKKQDGKAFKTEIEKRFPQGKIR